MKLYQPYEQKILRIAEIKAKIMRFKYLILAGLLLILAGISTLIYFKGTILSDLEMRNQYTYGEELEYEANAFLSKTTLVFYQDGRAIETPTRPGEYMAQVRARGAFGSKKYGEKQAFSIVRKPARLRLASASYMYGETPTVRVDGLVKGDRVLEEQLRFVYKGEFSGNSTVALSPGCFKIVNAKGEDVTNCYVFQEGIYEEREITWLRRPLVISTGDDQKLYDGKPFPSPDYQTDGLMDGHKIKPVSSCTATQPGSYANSLSYDIQTAKGESVKDYYSIRENWGELTIYTKKVVISVNDQQTYNGQEITTFTAKVVEGKLASGESVVITKAKAYDAGNQPTRVKDVGRYQIEILEYEILGSGGKEPQYLVELQRGTCTVTKRPITVTMEDVEKYYNRKPLTSNAFVADNPVSGHRIEIACSGSITEPGKTQNVLKTVEIYDENNQLVTHNYDITKRNGQLTVLKRKITVYPLPITKTYDGQAVAYPASMSKDMKVASDWTNPDDPLRDGEPLLSGDFIDFNSVSVGSRINVGVSDILLQGACIKDQNGVKDNGKYYDITVVSSKAVINPVEIEVYSLSHTRVYNGMTLRGSTEDCYINKGALVGKDTIQYTVNASISRVGQCLNLIREIVIKQNNGQVVGRIQCNDNGEIIQGNLSSYNYVITVVHGTLTIEESNE